MLKRYHISLLLGGLIGAIGLTACSKTLDTRSIEESITTELKQKGGLPVQAVSCPQDLKSEVGQSFECVGALNPDGGFFISVEQDDEQGQVSWEVPHSWRLLNLADLESEFQKVLQAQSKQPIKVDCGNNYRPTKPGDSFECQLTGQKSQPATILVKVEPQGKVTWQEVRQVAINPKPTATSNPIAGANASSPATAQPAAAKENDGAIGVKDETGWVQLAD